MDCTFCMKRTEQGLRLQSWQDNLYMSPSGCVNFFWPCMEEEVVERNTEDLGPEAFSKAMNVVGQPSLCVSSSKAESVGRFMSCSCGNCICVNGVTQTPAKFSCPIDQGWHAGEGSGRSFVLTSAMPESCCQPRWYILSKAQQWAPSACKPCMFAFYAVLCTFYKANGEGECNRSPSQRGCAWFSAGLDLQSPKDQSMCPIHLAC